MKSATFAEACGHRCAQIFHAITLVDRCPREPKTRSITGTQRSARRPAPTALKTPTRVPRPQRAMTTWTRRCHSGAVIAHPVVHVLLRRCKPKPFKIGYLLRVSLRCDLAQGHNGLYGHLNAATDSHPAAYAVFKVIGRLHGLLRFDSATPSINSERRVQSHPSPQHEVHPARPASAAPHPVSCIQTRSIAPPSYQTGHHALL